MERGNHVFNQQFVGFKYLYWLRVKSLFGSLFVFLGLFASLLLASCMPKVENDKSLSPPKVITDSITADASSPGNFKITLTGQCPSGITKLYAAVDNTNFAQQASNAISAGSGQSTATCNNGVLSYTYAVPNPTQPRQITFKFKAGTNDGKRSPGIATYTVNYAPLLNPATSVIWAGATSSPTNACSGAVTLTKKDASVTTTSETNVVISLTGMGVGGSFHTASDCSDGAVTTVNINQGQAATTLYYINSNAGAYVFNANVTTPAAGVAGGTWNFNVNAVAPDHIFLAGILGDGQTATVGTNVTVNPRVQVVDAGNNPVAGVVMQFTPSGDSTVSGGGLATTDASGYATITWTMGTTPGAYTLLAQRQTTALPGAPATYTFNATATVGVPHHLTYTAQPTLNQNIVAGTTFTVTAQVQDILNNVVTGATGNIVMSFQNNAGAGTLSGTLTQSVAAGSASFANLSIDKVGTGYTLSAAPSGGSIGGLTNIVTNAFNIIPAAAANLAFVQQPTNTTAGTTLAPNITVKVVDALGNTVTTGGPYSIILSVDASAAIDPVTAGACVIIPATQYTGTKTQNTAAGVATFNDLAITKACTGYKFSATSVPLTATTSTSFDITHNSATQLAFQTQPSNSSPTIAFPTQPAVEVLDAYNNRVLSSSASITVDIDPGFNPGAGTLSGTKVLSATSGLASYAGLSINNTGTGYKLNATSGGLATALSSAFNIQAGVATKLAFIQHPTNTVAGVTISPSITVQVQDAVGTLVSSDNTTVVTLNIQINPCGGSPTLNGTVAQTAVGGVATFNNLNIQKACNGYTLRATAGGLTLADSNTFNITPDVAHHLTYSQQPTNTNAAATVTPAVTVKIYDQYNNLTAGTNAITLAIGTNGGTVTYGVAGTLSGTLTQNAVAGTATFNDLSIDKAGVGYTLVATSAGLTSDTSSAFTINPAAASKLLYVQQPTNATSGASIAPAITVRVTDASNNTITSDNTTQITLAIKAGSGTGGAVLSGTLTATVVNGVATFSNLSIDKTGTAYILRATSSPVYTLADSTTFDINPGVATHLAYSVQPTNTVAGVSVSPAVVVQVLDANNNVVTTDNATQVTLAIGTNPGAGTLSGTFTSVTVTSGLATFSNLSINKVGVGYTLDATSSPVLTGATSTAFNITHAVANKLVYTTHPANSNPTVAFPAQPVLEIRDAFDNVVTTGAASTQAVTIDIDAGFNPGSGTLTPVPNKSVNAVAGVATFTGLKINNVGIGYKLLAQSAAVTSALSNLFDIVAGAATQLAFIQHPTNAVAGVSISPSITVQVQDGAAAVVSGDNTSVVTLNIQINPCGGSPALNGTVAQTVVNGVATFNNINIQKACNGYTLRATSGALTAANSNTFNITEDVPHHLAFLQQPTNTASGSSITPAVTVRVEDQFNNLVTTATNAVTMAIANNPSAGTLSGTLTQNAVAGVSTFNNLSIDKAGVGYTITATAAGLTSATSNSFDITAGAATKLLYVQQPTNTTSGASISPAVTVRVVDANNNTVTTDNTTQVTVAIKAGSGTGGAVLSGTATATVASGVATFSNLSIDKSGTAYILTATSSPVLTAVDSNTFDITAGAPAKLAYSVQPSNTASAANITPSVRVQVWDANNNLVTTATNLIGIAIQTNPSAGVLSGTASLNAVAGEAVFNNLNIDKAGVGYVLRATSGGLTLIDSNAFNITNGVAAKLAFIQQPTNTVAGSSISPSVIVEVQDAAGNKVLGDTSTIVMGIGTNPGGGTLSGTTSVAAINGQATFSNLSIDKTGVGYTLSATSVPLTSATSNAFNITAAAANKLVYNPSPSNSSPGVAFPTQPKIEIQDTYGNIVTTDNTTQVTLAIANNAGSPPGTLSGTLTVTASSGVATFAGLSLDKTGTGYTLGATSSPVLTAATSTAFNIGVGAPAKLVFLQQPTNTVAATSVSPAVTVQVLDAFDNLVTTDNATQVTIAIGTNPSAGTLSGTFTNVTVTGGVATFANLSINKSGVGYTLSATSGGLTSATSNAFNITAGAATQLAFSAQPTNTVAGANINNPTGILVQVQDANGNLVTTATNAITLAITAGFNPGSGTLSGTLTQNASGGVATFANISIDKVGSPYKLDATAGGLTTATSGGFTITVGAAAKLVYLQHPTDAVVGASIAPSVTVQVMDVNNNLLSGDNSTQVTLSIATNPPGTGILSGTITNVTVVNGVATFANLSIDKPGVGYTLSATSVPLTAATSNAFTINPGTPTKLAVTGPSPLNAGSCSTAYTVTSQDAGSNPSNVGVNTTVTLGGQGAGFYYSDAACTGGNEITTVQINSGTSAVNYYFKSNVSGAYTFTADAGGFTQGTKAVTVNPLAPTKLVWSGPSTVQAATCTLASNFVTTKDIYNNVSPVGSNLTVNLTGIGAGSFYSDSGCTTSATSVIVRSGQSTNDATGPSSLIYFKDNTAESLVFDAAAAGYVSGPYTYPFTVTPAVASKMVWSGPVSVTAGTCTLATHLLTTKDANNNVSAVTSDTTFTIAGVGSGAFYSDAACTGGNQITSVIVRSGQSANDATGPSTQIYFKDNVAESLVFTADKATWTQATYPFTVQPGTPTKLKLTTAPSNIYISTCTQFVVNSQDALNNNSNVSGNTQVNLSSSTGNAVFYASNANCTGSVSPVTNMVISTGTNTATFYIKDATFETFTLTAADNAAVLTQDTKVINVLIPPPNPTSVTPIHGTPFGGTTLTINGTDFVSGATVSISGTACGSVTFVNSTQLTCVTAAKAAGTYNLTVTNPDAQSGVLVSAYTYDGAPTITNISPNKGPKYGNVPVTITGTGFLPGATVALGGSNCASLTVVNSTTITCTTTSHALGFVNVVVTNTDTQTGTLTNGFQYAPAPADPTLSKVLTSATQVPSDNLAQLTIMIIPLDQYGNRLEPGEIMEVNVSSSNVTLSGAAACRTPLATCTKAVEHSNGSYSITATSAVVNAAYVFSAVHGYSPDVNIIQTQSVEFDTSKFTTISANTTITNVGHGGKNLYFTGGTATFDTTTQGQSFGNLFVKGGTVAHTATSTATMYKLDINATSLNVQSGSINANNIGYTVGYSYGSAGPATSLQPAANTAGGSHGGRGGANTAGVTRSGPTYDNYRDPSLPGSGSNWSGVGGGVIKINATNICVIANGATVTANGGGGAAGGTINLKCAGFAGAAANNSVTANGGAAVNATAGGGGGGNIALISSNTDRSFIGSFVYPTDAGTYTTFKSKVNAFGGVPVNATVTGGGAGTIYLKHSAITNGALIIDNNNGTSMTYANSGQTQLPSLTGTVGTPSGTNLPITVTGYASMPFATAPLTAAYTNLYAGMRIRPDVTFTNGTATDWTDDNLYTVASNNGTSLTMTAALAGVTNGTTFRTIDVLDNLEVSGNAVLESAGDIYVANGQLTNPGVSSMSFTNGVVLHSSTSAQDNLPTTSNLTAGTFDLTSYPQPSINTLTVAGATLTAGTLNVANAFTVSSGTVNHPAATATTEYKLNLNVGSLTMSGGSINTDVLGYPTGYSYSSTGPSTSLMQGYYPGASHGGSGGHFGIIKAAMPPYGDYRNPTTLGSGSSYSGAGGGAIKITSTGTCTINSGATLKANGTSWQSAGGSINLNCAGFAGTAAASAITANSVWSACCANPGGSGGRIALVSTGNASSFTGSFAFPVDSTTLTNIKSAVKAVGSAYYSANIPEGSAGTIFMKHSGQTYGTLIVDNGKTTMSINAARTLLPSMNGVTGTPSGANLPINVQSAFGLAAKYTNIFTGMRLRPDITFTNGTATDWTDDNLYTVASNNGTQLTMTNSMTGVSSGTNFHSIDIFDTIDVGGAAVLETYGDLYIAGNTILGGGNINNGLILAPAPSNIGGLTLTTNVVSGSIAHEKVVSHNLNISGGTLSTQKINLSGNLTMSGGVLTHPTSDVNKTYTLQADVNSFTMTGGSVDVSNVGYPAGYTYGLITPIANSGAQSYYGASHGGTGANSYVTTTIKTMMNTYDDFRAPMYPGSGSSWSGAGGGAVRITATNTCTINSGATINANATAASWQAAGGSIYLNCGGFAGTAGTNAITANSTWAGCCTGTGGGGRIALVSTGNQASFAGSFAYPTSANLTNFKQVVRAYGSAYYDATRPEGGPGTIYTKHSGLTYGDVIVDNGRGSRSTNSGTTEFISINDITPTSGVTFNPNEMQATITLSNNNLSLSTASGTWVSHRATRGVSSGKWYWEVKYDSGAQIIVGVGSINTQLNQYVGYTTDGYSYNAINGYKYNSNAGTAYGPGYDVGDVIGVALDMDNGTLKFYKNKMDLGVAFSNLKGTMYPMVGVLTAGATAAFNASQFTFTPPATYLAFEQDALSNNTFFQAKAAGTGPTVTLNPITTTLTLSNGNLTATNPAATWLSVKANKILTSGKWYWEVKPTAGVEFMVGVGGENSPTGCGTNAYAGCDPLSFGYYRNGSIYAGQYSVGNNGVYGAAFAANDIIGVALDMDNQILRFFKNGVDQGTAFTGINFPVYPVISNYSSTSNIYFASGTWTYSPPAGFSSLESLDVNYTNNNVLLTADSSPYRFKQDILKNLTVHIFPMAGGYVNPLDVSRIPAVISSVSSNMLTTTGSAFSTVGTQNTYHKITYRLDNLDIAGGSAVDMKGADLIVETCDIHSNDNTTFNIPVGSYFYGNGFASPNCTDSGISTKGTNFFATNLDGVVGPPASYVTMSGASTAVAGACSAAITLTKYDKSNVITTSGNVTVNLATTATGSFYTASDCLSGLVTSMNITGGTSTATVYYKSNASGNQILTTSGMALAQKTWPFTVTSDNPTSLVVTGAQAVAPSTCSSFIRVTKYDTNGNITTNGTPAVSFSGIGSATMYSDNTCTTSIPGTINIAAGTSYVDVYLSDAVQETITLSADAAGLTSGTRSIIIKAMADNLTSTVMASASKAPSDGGAEIVVATVPRLSNSSLLGTGQVLEVTTSSSNVVIYNSAGACRTPSATCYQMTDAGNGAYYIKARSPVTGTYTFTVVAAGSPDVTFANVPSVIFDSSQFTVFTANATVTSANAGQNLYFNSRGSTFTFDSTTEGMTVGDVFLRQGSVVVNYATTTATVKRFDLNVNSFHMDNASLNVDNTGYTAGYSFGAATPSTALARSGSGGASHGGIGGGTTPGAVYDDYRNPIYPGGGGYGSIGGGVIKITSTKYCTFGSSSSLSASATGVAGSAGGTINFTCQGYHTNLSTDTFLTTSNGCNGATSAGGGGRIALKATANGTQAFTGNLQYPTTATHVTNIRNYFNASSTSASCGGIYRGGSAGTVYLKHSASSNGALFINNKSLTITPFTVSDSATPLISMEGTTGTASGTNLPVTASSLPALSASYTDVYKGMVVRPSLAFTNGTANDWTDDNLYTVANNDGTSLTMSAVLSGSTNGTAFRSIDILDYLDVSGGAVVETYGDIYVTQSSLTDFTDGLLLSRSSNKLNDTSYTTSLVNAAKNYNRTNYNFMGGFKLAGGTINVSGLGYSAGKSYDPASPYGTGSVTLAGAADVAGSHGGRGAYWGAAVSGPTYDNYKDPQYPGAGGSWSTYTGGGVIKLTAAGTCTINSGTLNADATQYGSAGGTVNLKCAGFAGTAASNNVTARGTNYNGAIGGGGGGMIALISSGNAASFTGNFAYPTDTSKLAAIKAAVNAAGGYGTAGSSSSGGAGTIFLKHSASPYGFLIVNNNGNTYSPIHTLTAITQLPSFEGTTGSPTGANLPVTVTSSPTLSAATDNAFNGLVVRPDVSFTNGTANDWTDDNLYTISSSASNTLTMTSSMTGVSSGTTFRTIDILDNIDVSGTAIVETYSDIYIVSAPLSDFTDGILHAKSVNQINNTSFTSSMTATMSSNRGLWNIMGGFKLAGGSINLSGWGYGAGKSYDYTNPYGTGSTLIGSATQAGGSHGGLGGTWGANQPGATYDNYKDPQFPGAAANYSTYTGGGVIKLSASGTCTFNTGTVYANGANNGSAGGTINLKCGGFAGTAGAGAISANGTAYNGAVPGGGGGMIALISSGNAATFTGNFTYPTNSATLNTLTSTVTTFGGNGFGGSTMGGGAGTIYLKHSAQNNGMLIVDNGQTTPYFYTGYGTTQLVSMAGTTGTPSGANLPVTVTSSPGLTANFTNVYAGMQLRPDVTFTNGTSTDWSDDNLYTVASNDGTSLTMTNSLSGVSNGTTLRTIHVLDYLVVKGGAVLNTNGDIYVLNPSFTNGVNGIINIAGSNINSNVPSMQVDSGTFYINNITANNLTINGGTIYPPATSSSVNINTLGTFTMNGGAINTTGFGYAPGMSWSNAGPSTALAHTGTAGASHGGRGGNATSGQVYDSITNPQYPGEGGWNTSKGGGVITVTAGGLCTINATAQLRSDGGGNGSAGGTINMNCAGFAGNTTTGNISANGAGYNGSTSGGGGGRIAMVSTGDSTTFSGNLVFPTGSANLNTFKASVYARGGAGFCGTTCAGAAGTIFVKNSTQTYGSLIINNGVAAISANDGTTEFISATDNANTLNSKTDNNTVNVTAAGTPYTGKLDLFKNLVIHIFPVAGGYLQPLNGGRTPVTLTGNGTNTFLSSGGFATVGAADTLYRFTYRFDHLDIGGYSRVDLKGADLILQNCDLHSAVTTTYDVPTGSSVTGYGFASGTCSNAARTGSQTWTDTAGLQP